MQLDISENLVQKNHSTSTLADSAKQELRFRCPCCQKLYSTTADAFEEAHASDSDLSLPEFDCQSCFKSFVLTKKTNEFGLLETQVNNHVFSECPKCTKLMPLNHEECPSCGVFIEKYQQVAQAENPMLFELNKLWKNVLENFNQDARHQEFLNLCQRKMALNLAFQKYDELRKTMNYDATCEKYLNQIETRLEQQFINQRAIEQKAKAEPKKKMTQKVFAWVSLFGFALLIFNKVRPTFPNVNGLIVAITVLAFSLWLVSSQNKNNIKL
ncbi:MAG: hypothetical protein H7256_14205 [Bdellovibrio sp.]|nr:hypothetical protein [Bdellovibrio sp.]